MKNVKWNHDKCLQQITAMHGWLEYVEGELHIEQKIYYPGSEYMEEDAYAGYGMYYPIVMERAANRTKEYAIEI